MPKKYHINIKETPPRFHPVGKFATVEFREECAGSCSECVKKKCIYDIFEQNYLHMSNMEEPQYLYTCESCFRCVQECTRGIFSRVINPEYAALGDEYWTPDIVHQTWVQAQTGRVPVSGAGYGGRFTGPGFDAMWTDMSEIVRPTRDGIHGREYINTSIELSRRSGRLEIAPNGSISAGSVPILEVPLPLLFSQPEFGLLGRNVLLTMVAAAQELGTLMFIQPEDFQADMDPYIRNLVARLDRNNLDIHTHLVQNCRMLELADEANISETIGRAKAINPDIFVSVGLALDKNAPRRALELAGMQNIDSLHFYADSAGNETDASRPRFISEMIREIQLGLVEARLRFRINLLFSGGIALAEHLAKAVICGADGVTIDRPLLLALECRMCFRCLKSGQCPVKMADVRLKWGRQRILNLVGAWRNQLIEVMGAMGIREARRLSGEIGRSMWFEELEKESFGPLFGQRKAGGLG